MANIAAARAHRRVIHRIGGEAVGGIAVAIAALDPGDRDMRRRRVARRRRAIVTT